MYSAFVEVFMGRGLCPQTTSTRTHHLWTWKPQVHFRASPVLVPYHLPRFPYQCVISSQANHPATPSSKSNATEGQSTTRIVNEHQPLDVSAEPNASMTEVVLGVPPYGLLLEEVDETGDIFVAQIQEGSQADKSGKIHVGDMLEFVSATFILNETRGLTEQRLIPVRGVGVETVINAIDSNWMFRTNRDVKLHLVLSSLEVPDDAHVVE